MLNIVCGGILCVCLSYIGYEIRRIYLNRVNYMRDFNSFIDELVEEISFSKAPLKEFTARVAQYKKKEFRNTLKEFDKANEECREIRLKTPFIQSKDVEVIQNCFNSLGKTDAATQIYNLKNYKIRAEDMLKRAEYNLKTKGALYGKLGVLIGIALMILIA